MPVTVVVGGQFGSEGKGKVVLHLAKEFQNSTLAPDVTAVVRVGGSNSGHTVVHENKKYVFRHLPTACLLPGIKCVLPAGSYIDLSVLLDEIKRVRLPEDRLLIDYRAALISSDDKKQEKDQKLYERVGSTESGTGQSVARRVHRQHITFAEFEPKLAAYIGDAPEYLSQELNQVNNIIVEGSQGFGLSNLHSPYYPYTTSRDTSAAAAIAEAGLSPIDVGEIVLVLRTFPIRVEGNSGSLPNEIDWKTVEREGGHTKPLVEYTSVTGRKRRVGRFDGEIVKKAIMVNSPTTIVLNHLDYVDAAMIGSTELTDKAREFTRNIEEQIERPIIYIGNSPSDLLLYEW